MRFAGFNGFGQSLVVHVADHQHVAGMHVGCHHRHQAIGVELWCKVVAFFHLLDGKAFGELWFFTHGSNSKKTTAPHIYYAGPLKSSWWAAF